MSNSNSYNRKRKGKFRPKGYKRISRNSREISALPTIVIVTVFAFLGLGCWWLFNIDQKIAKPSPPKETYSPSAEIKENPKAMAPIKMASIMDEKVDFQTPNLLEAQKSTYSSNHPIYNHRIATVTVPSLLPEEPMVTVDGWIPIDSQGRLAPTASDVVLVFPNPAQLTLGNVGYARLLVDKMGFTALMPRFQHLRGPLSGQPVTSYFIYPASGSDEVYLRAMKLITKAAGLNNVNLYAMGESMGGSGAQLFSSEHPEIIHGLFNGMGGTFNLERPYLGPMIFCHSALDRVEASTELRTALAKFNNTLDEFLYPPLWSSRGNRDKWAHHIPREAMIYGLTWLRWIADSTRANRPLNEPCPTELMTLRQAIQTPAMSLDIADLGINNPVWLNYPVEKPERFVLWIDARFTAGEADVHAAADMWTFKKVACLGMLDDNKLGSGDLEQLISRAINSQNYTGPVAIVAIEPGIDRIAAMEGLAQPNRPVIAWFGSPGKARHFEANLSPTSSVRVRIPPRVERMLIHQKTENARIQELNKTLQMEFDREDQAMSQRHRDELSALKLSLKRAYLSEQISKANSLKIEQNIEAQALKGRYKERQIAILKNASPSNNSSGSQDSPPSTFWGAALQARINDVAEVLTDNTLTTNR